MTIKIITLAIFLFTVFMGFRQGYAMVTGTPEITALFGKWNFPRSGTTIFGAITILSAAMILFPKTYFLGNSILALSILLIICLHLSVKDVKAASIEIPFMVMNLFLIYFGYPFAR